MKHTIIYTAICCFLSLAVIAQTPEKTVGRPTIQTDEEVKEGGFKKENLFTGGSVALSFGSNTFSFGLGPYFGYSVNKYLDVAATLNYNYISQRDYYSTAKIRQNVIGPGAFVRVFPVKFLFAHAQYEQNFITQKFIPDPTSGQQSDKQSLSVGSFLIGPGYATGREGGNTFFYISVLFDVAKNQNSPYTDQLGRINPVFRTGFNIALFQGSKRSTYQPGGSRRF